MNVVVVDDDPLVRLVLAKAVTSMGHNALPAETGETALEIVESKPIDVVISDWLMPGMSGLELCELIRARDQIEYVYFVLVTALDDSEHALAGIAAGVDDCLVKPVRPFDLRLRLMVAERVTGLHRRLAERQRGLERTNLEMAATARMDPLTGLGNRLKMAEDLEIFRSRRDRYHERFGVALFDIDHFKALNDAAGHLVGDKALRAVATVIRTQLREADMAYRYGGEELLVVLPAGVRRVAAAAERIRKAVEDAAIPHPGRPAPETVVTLSVGVAPGEGDVESFLLAADEALYRAKSQGRNRMVVAGRWLAVAELAASP
ncbi:MAG TPA: diguanylate cyclase [Actinomycetes bacterium]|nr:diguanylate cyclase [Actinomycetes bacterium]